MQTAKKNLPADERHILIELFERKLAFCQRIADSTRALGRALAAENIEHVSEAIAERQRYMDEVDRLDGIALKLKSHKFTDVRNDIRMKVNSLLSDIDGVLQATVPINRACEESVVKFLAENRTELQEVQHARRAFQGYAKAKQPTARFFDGNV